jgi:uncharacterized protein YbjT (DUF2867 family)
MLCGVLLQSNGKAAMDTDPPILTVGASGPFAGHVVPALTRCGAHVRGMIRNEAQAAEVRGHGAAETVVADLRDEASPSYS